jgi:protein-L-isoaspartate(D-aspartate) O-methyltransferase
LLLEDSYRHQGQRRQLVKLLAEKGIADQRVLAAIGQVPRHLFFEAALQSHAYQDKAFPIGEGQTISQPYTVARQTELLDLQPGDKVLEIGTGSGYQCCVLLQLASRVYTIEYNRVLYNITRQRLPQMGYNATFLQGDGSLGYAPAAPYHKILVTAGAPAVPEALLAQLKPGGILVIPVGPSNNQRMLRLCKSAEGVVNEEDCGPFSFVPLLGKSGWGK